MNFDLGDIVFFGILAVVILSNIVRAVKRRSQVPESQPEQLPQKAENDDYDWWQEDKTEQVIKAAQPMQARSMPFHREGRSGMKTKRATQNFERKRKGIEIIEDTRINIDLSDASEAKKAVIYSEIFNRKFQ